MSQQIVGIDCQDFNERLQIAVLDELDLLDLACPQALAQALNIAEISARGMLDRKLWSIQSLLWVAERLRMPIELGVIRLSTTERN